MMRCRTTLIAAALHSTTAVFAAVGAAPVDPTIVSVDCATTGDELRSGHVAVVNRPPTDGRGVALQACGLVDAPPTLVWSVVRDCDKFDQFLPRVSRSILESRAGDVAVCDETIDLPFPLADLHSVSRVVESKPARGGFERRWSLVRGTYRRLEGGWVVLPWDDAGAQSLVIYEVDMDPETILPDFLVRRAQAGAAVEVYGAIRRRVRSCAAADQSSPCEVE